MLPPIPFVLRWAHILLYTSMKFIQQRYVLSLCNEHFFLSNVNDVLTNGFPLKSLLNENWSDVIRVYNFIKRDKQMQSNIDVSCSYEDGTF